MIIIKKVVSFIFIVFIFLPRPAYSAPSMPKLENFEENITIPSTNVPETINPCTSSLIEQSKQLHEDNIKILQQRYSSEIIDDYMANQPEDCYVLYRYRFKVNNSLDDND